MQKALLVGLTSVDSAAYNGWDGKNGCWGCELDVDNIQGILVSRGYDIEVFKTKRATRQAVLDSLTRATTTLKTGDHFVFYYSGHGGQQLDHNSDEQDGKDETLVAYDGELIDDVLDKIWLEFDKGVHLVMISDSCNSGTNYRLLRDVHKPTPLVFVCNRTASKMEAEMIHLAGCRDGHTSSGYLSGGAFTQALCELWDGGSFVGTYRAFLDGIRQRVNSGQIPQYSEYGPVSEHFRNEKPFSPGHHNEQGRSGAIASVKCILDIPGGHLRDIKATIGDEAVIRILEALDDALSQRPGSATPSCTGSSSGSVSCTGSVTVHW